MSSEIKKLSNQKLDSFVGLWTEAELLWGPEAACGLEVERVTPSTPLPGILSVPASKALAGEDRLLTQQGSCWVGAVDTGTGGGQEREGRWTPGVIAA